jgi:ECF transporter S component (folate family)
MAQSNETVHKKFDITKYFTFRFDLKSLVTLGMLLAAFVVLDLITIKIGEGFKFNVAFIPVAVSGALFGPLPTALLCVAGDLIGCIIGGQAPMWQLTLTAGLTGIIYGFTLYSRTGKNLAVFAIIARVLDSIIITVCLNTLVLMAVGFVSPTLAGFLSRAAKALIEMPIYSAVLALLLPQIVALYKVISRGVHVKT